MAAVMQREQLETKTALERRRAVRRRRTEWSTSGRSTSELGPGAVISSLIAHLVPSIGDSSSGPKRRLFSDVISEPSKEQQPHREQTKAEFMWYGSNSNQFRQQQQQHQKSHVTTELERILKERQTLNNNKNNKKPKKSRRLYHSADRIDQLLVNKQIDQRLLNNYRVPPASSETHLNEGGLYSMWFKWFKRNNSRARNREPPDLESSAHLHNHALIQDLPPPPPQRTSSQQVARSASTASPLISRRPSKQSARSQSVENSPVLPARRRNDRMVSAESTDSLSTHSFAFIRATPVVNNGQLSIEQQVQVRNERNELSLRKKYGLDFVANEVEGEAVRAMRTEFETQMSEVKQNGRKKRQAPPPPSNQNRTSVSSIQAHVPGKRKAPCPPDLNAKLNILPKEKEVKETRTYSDSDQAIALPIQEDELKEKLIQNDLSHNLDDRSTKVLNKIIECPHNDTLKLEGGLLRPFQESTTVSSATPSESGSKKLSRRRTIDETSPLSTVQSNGRMTLPLKPWYKRANQLPSPQHKEARSKWKDAALIHSAPSADENCSWVLDAYRKPYLYGNQFGTSSMSSPESTLSVRVASPTQSTEAPPTSPGGSSNKSSSSSSTEGSKRKSLLVNISQLDKEAAEIIQKERERESQRRKKLEDEKFYSDVPPPLPSSAPPVEDSDARVKGTKELIDMFNAMDHTKVNHSSNEDIAKMNSISRLRVNNETIDDPKPSKQNAENVVFQPKFDYPGGARPKRALVTNSQEKETKGWTCSVCTLINSEARLWCEVCTALRPRKSLNYSSPLTAKLNGTDEKTKEAQEVAPTEKMDKKEVKLERSSSKYWEEEIKKYFVNDACKKTEAREEKEVEEKVNNKVPTSPEALRQARLAFFTTSTETPSVSPVPRPDSPTVGDLVQRRLLAKVSSGVQTADNETSSEKRGKIPSVQPTQFVLPSHSRTQLSQYIQQRDKARSVDSSTDRLTVKPTVNNPSPSPDEEEKRIKTLLKGLEEAITCGQFDKAAVLAKELAATKQKQTGLKFDSSSSSPSPIPQEVKTADSEAKPVAAKRTVVPPERTQSRNSTTSSFQSASPAPPVPAERSLSRVSTSSGSVYANVSETHPVPVKRQGKSEGQRTLHRQNEPKEQKAITEEKKEEKEEKIDLIEVKEAPVPAPRVLVRQISMEGEVKPPEPVLPIEQPKKESISLSRILDRKQDAEAKDEKTEKPLTKTKVDSAQQTTISYNKPVGKVAQVIEEQNQVKEDPSFKVRILIEDRSNNHSAAPFYWSVTKETTLGELKERLDRERNVQVAHQRWILGRRLANDERANLEHYDIGPENCYLYVYVLAETPKAAVVEAVKEMKQVTPPPPVQAPPPGKYYNFEEDRYSTCEESDEEPENVVRIQVQHQENTEDEAIAKEDYKKLLELEHSDLVPNAEEMECPICLMAVPPAVGVTLRDCLHSFCKDCLAHVIEFSDEAAVSCPYRDDNYHCDSTLQEREIKALVSDELYEKHLARSMRLAEKRIKNTFHCQTADCTGWAVIEDNVNTFRCPVCSKVNCLTCQAIHEGVNCKEYQDELKQSAETDDDAKQTQEMIEALVASGEALSCPSCQVILMKRWGCDWVRCSVCRTEICWVTRQARWGPKGKGDTSGGCRCGVDGVKCHALCNYCH